MNPVSRFELLFLVTMFLDSCLSRFSLGSHLSAYCVLLSVFLFATACWEPHLFCCCLKSMALSCRYAPEVSPQLMCTLMTNLQMTLAKSQEMM